MPDCVRCGSRAVCVKLPVRASTQNARNCRLSRGAFIHESDSWFASESREAVIAPTGNSGALAAMTARDAPGLPPDEQKLLFKIAFFLPPAVTSGLLIVILPRFKR